MVKRNVYGVTFKKKAKEERLGIIKGLREETGKGFTDLREAVKGLGGDGEGKADLQERRRK